MKEFIKKYRHQISFASNLAIIIIGIVLKDIRYLGIGAALIALTVYINKAEKKEEERIAKEKAERKAQKQAMHKGKKKKSKKRR